MCEGIITTIKVNVWDAQGLKAGCSQTKLSHQGKKLPPNIDENAEEGDVSDEDSADEMEDDCKLMNGDVWNLFLLNNADLFPISKKWVEDGWMNEMLVFFTSCPAFMFTFVCFCCLISPLDFPLNCSLFLWKWSYQSSCSLQTPKNFFFSNCIFCNWTAG